MCIRDRRRPDFHRLCADGWDCQPDGAVPGVYAVQLPAADPAHSVICRLCRRGHLFQGPFFPGTSYLVHGRRCAGPVCRRTLRDAGDTMAQ